MICGLQPVIYLHTIIIYGTSSWFMHICGRRLGHKTSIGAETSHPDLPERECPSIMLSYCNITFLHLNKFGASNPFDFLAQEALRSQEYKALVAVFQYQKSWILCNIHFRPYYKNAPSSGTCHNNKLILYNFHFRSYYFQSGPIQKLRKIESFGFQHQNKHKNQI